MIHVWDIDGTVLDSMKMWESVPSLYVKSLGIEPPENLAEILDPLTVPETNAYIAETFGIEGGAEAVSEGIMSVVLDQYENALVAYEDALAELEELKASGVKMYTFSNTPHFYLDRGLKRNDLMKYFDEVYTVEDVGLRKNDANAFITLCEMIGASPADVVVHDDASYALDAAREAGCSVKEYDRYR